MFLCVLSASDVQVIGVQAVLVPQTWHGKDIKDTYLHLVYDAIHYLDFDLFFLDAHDQVFPSARREVLLESDWQNAPLVIRIPAVGSWGAL